MLSHSSKAFLWIGRTVTNPTVVARNEKGAITTKKLTGKYREVYPQGFGESRSLLLMLERHAPAESARNGGPTPLYCPENQVTKCPTKAWASANENEEK